MELKQYLKNENIKVTDFAKKMGCVQSYISLICNKDRRPSPEFAKKIERGTNGKVTVMELLFPDREAA